jgi:hypothetical protein
LPFLLLTLTAAPGPSTCTEPFLVSIDSAGNAVYGDVAVMAGDGRGAGAAEEMVRPLWFSSLISD